MIGVGLIAVIVGWIAAMSLIANRIRARSRAALARVIAMDVVLCAATVAAAFFFFDRRAGVSAVTGLAAGALLASLFALIWMRRSVRRRDQG